MLDQVREEGYTARVERVEPAIPGLIVESFPSANGALQITNETGQDVHIWQSRWRRRNEPGWRKIPPGETLLVDDDVRYGGFFEDNQPMGQNLGQVMKTWTIQGRVEDTPFVIYGVTVYDPLPP